MSRPKGLKIDVIGSPEASNTGEIPDYARENYDSKGGAHQAHTRNELNVGLDETNGIPLRSDIDTEVGQQRPVLDEYHPNEFTTNTRTRGGSDPTRD
jgi:hypothetical protein